MKRGQLVRDTATGKVGVLLGATHDDAYYRLRPVQGGTEWKAHPLVVTPLSEREALLVKVREENRRSRAGR